MKKNLIIKKIKLGESHQATHNTRHYLGNQEVTNDICELKIVKYFDTKGYYLMYFDKNGKELTDTYHDTLERAMHQAEFEFNVKPEEWQSVNEEYKP